jgi:hypothetical protein
MRSNKLRDEMPPGLGALAAAAHQGQASVVEALLGSADIDAQTGEDRFSALMLAARAGHREVAALLLDNGAKPNLQNAWGATALMLAAHQSRIDLVELLLARGAEAGLHDTEGWTALVWASRNGHTSIARLLLLADMDEEDLSDVVEGLDLDLQQQRQLRAQVGALRPAAATAVVAAVAAGGGAATEGRQQARGGGRALCVTVRVLAVRGLRPNWLHTTSAAAHAAAERAQGRATALEEAERVVVSENGSFTDATRHPLSPVSTETAPHEFI